MGAKISSGEKDNMKIFKRITFKEIMDIINKTFGICGFGFGASSILKEDYKAASFSLLVVSILFIVGYFVEQWNQLDC